MQLTPNHLAAADVQRGSLGQILDLGCNVSRYRVLGGSYWELVNQARSVARLAAATGTPMESPLTQLFQNQRERYYTNGPTLGWEFARAYKAAWGELDPARYFAVTYENAFVTIRSTGLHSGAGEIKFNADDVDAIFECAETDTERSYLSWALNDHPVGGYMLLQRIDDPDDDNFGRLRLLVSDVHPCRGSLDFGEVEQELDQLGAFIKLRPLVMQLFAQGDPSDEERAATAVRAAEIGRRMARDFLPSSGYCYWCNGDVTVALAGVKEGATVTSCPLCWHTWCD